MRLILLSLFTMILGSLHSQRIGPYLIGSQSATYETEDLVITSALGEPINSLEEDEGIILSQGLLYSVQSLATENLSFCTAKQGIMFFQNCDDGTPFFFIRGDDGLIYDPYYGEGVEFEEEDSLRVLFGFQAADFPTPCSVADRAVVLTCVEAEVSTSNQDILSQTVLEIYPNPTAKQLEISFTQQLSDSILRIYSSEGKLMSRRELSAEQVQSAVSVSLSAYPAGLYYLSMASAEGIITKSFIKVDQ